MDLRPETQEILHTVEEATSFRVELLHDPALPYLARITRATPATPVHLLRYNPTRGAPDYLIAYEAGFVLRLAATPPDARADLASTEPGQAAVVQLVKRAGQTAALPAQVRAQLATRLYDGLMTQLRSYPIGMRVDRWLWDAYPALQDLQTAAIAEQQQTNLGALTPEVRAMEPKPIWERNVAMNAAYALFCDRLFGQKAFAIPYRSIGLDKRGRALLDRWEAIPAEPTHDRALVDAWAAELDVGDWYRWVPAP